MLGIGADPAQKDEHEIESPSHCFLPTQLPLLWFLGEVGSQDRQLRKNKELYAPED